MSLTVFGSFGIFPSCSGSDSPSANPIIKCNEVFSALVELGDKNNIKAIFKTEKERGFLLLPSLSPHPINSCVGMIQTPAIEWRSMSMCRRDETCSCE